MQNGGGGGGGGLTLVVYSFNRVIVSKWINVRNILRNLVTTAATCLDQERSSLMMTAKYLNSSTGCPYFSEPQGEADLAAQWMLHACMCTSACTFMGSVSGVADYLRKVRKGFVGGRLAGIWDPPLLKDQQASQF